MTDGSLKGSLDSFEKGDRQKWFLEHQQTMGSDLNLALRTACRQTNSIAATEGFGGRGVWLDEVDLAEKYKNKPDQLQSIKARARSITHPTRGVQVWEDIDLDSSFMHSGMRFAENALDITADEQVQKKKR